MKAKRQPERCFLGKAGSEKSICRMKNKTISLPSVLFDPFLNPLNEQREARKNSRKGISNIRPSLCSSFCMMQGRLYLNKGCGSGDNPFSGLIAGNNITVTKRLSKGKCVGNVAPLTSYDLITSRIPCTVPNGNMVLVVVAVQKMKNNLNRIPDQGLRGALHRIH